MNNSNPYAPPQSVVADVEAHTADDVRPKTVNIAVALLWLSAALGVISNVIRMFNGAFPPNVPQIVPILTIALSLAFASWFNIKIATRRNWARIIWVVLLAIGILVLLAKPTLFTKVGTMMILFGVQHVLGIATAVLLLTPTSNRWFKKRSA